MATLGNAIKAIVDDRAVWLVDAVACATQNRALLRGDPQEDKVLTEALLLNAQKAISVAIDKALTAKELATEK
jgi:hypothetical protein